jgi:uncharacterized membrane protein
MWWWGPGWWWIGAVVMVICMVAMGQMMGHGHWRRGDYGWKDEPERTLADRLARGEIDTEEYDRLFKALWRSRQST